MKIDDDLWARSATDITGRWCLIDGALTKTPFPDVQVDFAALIAAERYQREASGVVVDGSTIDTSRDGQALIAGAAVSAILDSSYKCSWKTAEGFVELDAPRIISIATAVRAHVQTCFDRELTLLRAVETGTYRDSMLTEGWPDSSPPEKTSVITQLQ
ncbi:DUF4376 domain-containing protein [Pseudomonas sp. ADAK2]|nr:DUF4376 domain-containing protein [Pseudomonas sp. ADAK7]QJI51885.1 DUF4376 domain-containing protein [Pseudomonas sp. ADAK2]